MTLADRVKIAEQQVKMLSKRLRLLEVSMKPPKPVKSKAVKKGVTSRKEWYDRMDRRFNKLKKAS